MTMRVGVGVLVAAVAITVVWIAATPREVVSERTVVPIIPANAKVMETARYRIHYTSTDAQAMMMGEAVEQLYTAYANVFPPPASASASASGGKLSLVLFGQRSEFKKNNRARPWAEAYYLKPNCFAYFDLGGANPYHWMLHEATHQLATEVSGFKRNAWIDEGLATYFSASQMGKNGLELGKIDWNTYPIWGLRAYEFSGDLVRDTANRQFVRLEHLLGSSGGPDADRYFNLYYINAWSLTHFMFHHADGKYAESYKRFLASDVSSAAFVKLLGPLERIEEEWYRYRVALQDPLTHVR